MDDTNPTPPCARFTPNGEPFAFTPICVCGRPPGDHAQEEPHPLRPRLDDAASLTSALMALASATPSELAAAIAVRDAAAVEPTPPEQDRPTTLGETGDIFNALARTGFAEEPTTLVIPGERAAGPELTLSMPDGSVVARFDLTTSAFFGEGGPAAIISRWAEAQRTAPRPWPPEVQRQLDDRTLWYRPGLGEAGGAGAVTRAEPVLPPPLTSAGLDPLRRMARDLEASGALAAASAIDVLLREVERLRGLHRCDNAAKTATCPRCPEETTAAEPDEAAPCVLTGKFDRPDDHPNGPHREWKTWCGRRVPEGSEWVFLDASHAALSGLAGTPACRCCAREIAAAVGVPAGEPRPKVDPLSAEATAALDPGITKLVTRLRAWGFETTDSGDGKSKFSGPHPNAVGACGRCGEALECVYCNDGIIPIPHVAIASTPGRMNGDASAVYGLLRAMGVEPAPGDIQATYDPAQGGRARHGLQHQRRRPRRHEGGAVMGARTFAVLRFDETNGELHIYEPSAGPAEDVRPCDTTVIRGPLAMELREAGLGLRLFVQVLGAQDDVHVAVGPEAVDDVVFTGPRCVVCSAQATCAGENGTRCDECCDDGTGHCHRGACKPTEAGR